ncbi:MAG: S8 family serine peptidase, partial [Cyclobacteriaceae bacterium]
LGIDKIWPIARGSGVKVAIVDTGIDLRNNDLSSAVYKAFNILDGSENAQDLGYHGTYCASILASRGENGIVGIAPACDLIVVKVAQNEIFPISQPEIDLLEKNRLNGVKKAVELGADILSISFGSTRENSEMTMYLNEIMEKGIICIAAAGNNRNDVVNYPANMRGVISVGNIGCSNPNGLSGNPDFFLSQMSPGVPSQPDKEGVTLVAPGDKIDVYNSFGKIVSGVSGSSFSAPFVAGTASLWLEIIRQKGAPKNAHKAFRKFLIDNADTSPKNYSKTTWGAGVIRPIRILEI